MLWLFQRVFYGRVTNDHNKGLTDLSLREWVILGPLAAAAIGMGVFPNVFLKPMEPAVQRIVDRVQARQPMEVAEAVIPYSSRPKPKTPRIPAERPKAPAPQALRTSSPPAFAKATAGKQDLTTSRVEVQQ
jgi:hypothetical protein